MLLWFSIVSGRQRRSNLAPPADVCGSNAKRIPPGISSHRCRLYRHSPSNPPPPPPSTPSPPPTGAPPFHTRDIARENFDSVAPAWSPSPSSLSASPSHLRQPVSRRDQRWALHGSPHCSAIFLFRPSSGPASRAGRGGPGRPRSTPSRRGRTAAATVSTLPHERWTVTTGRTRHALAARSAAGGRRRHARGLAHRENTTPKLKNAPMSHGDGPVG